MQMYDLPDARGHFGPYGGVFVAETLMAALDELKDEYEAARHDPDFRPSSIMNCATTSAGPARSTTPSAGRKCSAARRST
jgi:tryptophan synthase beta subunit